MGLYEYQVELNASTQTIAELNDLPIKMVNGSPILIRDVAHVRDGYPPQPNVVRVDGHRAVLMTIQKTGAASTLDIISRVKAKLQALRDALPPELDIHPIADQSVFVSAAIGGVVREGLIAASLTALMILLFLGSLAQHANYRHLDSAVRAGLRHRVVRLRADHQHHDAGRVCAGGRHPCRRCHGDHREYQCAS